MLHSNFVFLSSIEPELLPIENLYHGNKDLCAFCSCDLDRDLMTFTYDFDPYPLKVYLQTKNKLSTSRLQKLLHYTHTYRQTYTHTMTKMVVKKDI